MRFRPEQDRVMRSAVEYFGDEHQVDMWFEESAELTKELCKSRRGADNGLAVAEEIADCLIMLEQLMMIYGCRGFVSSYIRSKLKRLQRRMAEEAVGHDTSSTASGPPSPQGEGLVGRHAVAADDEISRQARNDIGDTQGQAVPSQSAMRMEGE